MTKILIIALIYLLKGYTHLKSNLLLTGGLLVVQVTLGVLNVLLSIPMVVAVLHNAVALLLLLSVVALIHKVFKAPI